MHMVFSVKIVAMHLSRLKAIAFAEKMNWLVIFLSCFIAHALRFSFSFSSLVLFFL